VRAKLDLFPSGFQSSAKNFSSIGAISSYSV
jgi:hypothetical protein